MFFSKPVYILVFSSNSFNADFPLHAHHRMVWPWDVDVTQENSFRFALEQNLLRLRRCV